MCDCLSARAQWFHGIGCNIHVLIKKSVLGGYKLRFTSLNPFVQTSQPCFLYVILSLSNSGPLLNLLQSCLPWFIVSLLRLGIVYVINQRLVYSLTCMT
jgi:hypothetical protein